VGSDQRMSVHGRKVTVVVQEKSGQRRYKEIRDMIKSSDLPDQARGMSLTAFGRLAEVEARIHNCAEDDVHFHELGALDTIVDIVGTALAIAYLKIEKTFASEIPLGKGFVTCAHGKLPLPAPATLALLKGVPVYGTDVCHELVTPTGAALLTTFADTFGPLPPMHMTGVGYGIGTRDLKTIPNLLRVVVGEAAAGYERDRVAVIETNIDDMNPEIFGFVMEKLFEGGALDVTWIPVHMKKNRPGTMIQVICKQADIDAVVRCLLSETTATGLRYHLVERLKLSRTVESVRTTLGEVKVKVVTDPGQNVHMVPEYEVCRRIAIEKKLPLKVVYERLIKELST
ncbi:MAG: nickel pincer cofactor biosynthesis protein LarC, partial [Deltaproteobacteria bacterium]|nr:nickel pincer cofactor biosynthesis protein LarC [Deltaproteobacteria bacterium]